MKTTIQIEGMSCEHCVKRVTRALGDVAGVSVRDVRIGEATIEHSGPDQSAAAVRALDDAGYAARLRIGLEGHA